MSENKEYITYSEEKGSVNISEEVVAVIAATAATEVDGVAGLYPAHGRDIAELLGKKSLSRGVKIRIEDKKITAEVYIMAEMGSAVSDVGTAVQEAVATAIESSTGLTIEAVNIHICGIALHREK